MNSILSVIWHCGGSEIEGGTGTGTGGGSWGCGVDLVWCGGLLGDLIFGLWATGRVVSGGVVLLGLGLIWGFLSITGVLGAGIRLSFRIAGFADTNWNGCW